MAVWLAAASVVRVPSSISDRRTELVHSIKPRIPPLLLLAFYGAMVSFWAHLLPVAGVDIPAGRLVALAVTAAGGIVAVAGVLEFRRHRTTVNPIAPSQSSTLVSTGIYRFTRNPMYLGFLLILVGWSIVVSSFVAVPLVVLFVLHMNRQIAFEEQALHAAFGEAFGAYCKRVRRWL